MFIYNVLSFEYQVNITKNINIKKSLEEYVKVVSYKQFRQENNFLFFHNSFVSYTTNIYFC